MFGCDVGVVGLGVRVLTFDDDGAFEGESTKEAAGFGVRIPVTQWEKMSVRLGADV